VTTDAFHPPCHLSAGSTLEGKGVRIADGDTLTVLDAEFNAMREGIEEI
jgi:hypothetical protein